MNVVPLRRAIIKEFIILAALCLFSGVGLWAISVLYDDFEQKKNNASRVANELMAQKQSIETKFTAVKSNMGVYQESQRWAESPGLFIDSQAVRDLFNYYQSILFIKKMSVEMQPIADMTGTPSMVREHFVVTKTSAKVMIDAVSDEDVYALLRVMQSELPGFLRVVSFTLKKTKDLSKEVLAEVRKQGSSSVVTAEIQLDWYGLRSTDSASNFNKYVPIKRKEKTQ
jgi:hypothetical protein